MLKVLSGWKSISDQVTYDPKIPMKIVCVRLEDLSITKEIELDQNDLIKADAEGADLDVLIGAEDQIRRNSPQIAITTYHVDYHAERMIDWLRKINPEYKIRLKGLSFWTTFPRPVLIQASTL